MTEDAKIMVLRDQWLNIVQEYSKRELTVAADKLDAIEGMVTEHRRETGDEYFAGLWGQRLLREMSWYQDARDLGSASLNWNQERTCPSWSWIKVDGPVRFSFAENTSAEVESAEVFEHETTGTYPNLHLTIRGGLRVRAPLSTLTAIQILKQGDFEFVASGTSRRVFRNEILPDGSLTNPNFTTTDPQQPGIPFDLRFMELSWGKEDGRQNIANESRGLLLVPATDKRTDLFRRVGFFRVALGEDPGWSHVSSLALRKKEARSVVPTTFGKLWKESLKEKVVCIV